MAMAMQIDPAWISGLLTHLTSGTTLSTDAKAQELMAIVNALNAAAAQGDQDLTRQVMNQLTLKLGESWVQQAVQSKQNKEDIEKLQNQEI